MDDSSRLGDRRLRPGSSVLFGANAAALVGKKRAVLRARLRLGIHPQRKPFASTFETHLIVTASRVGHTFGERTLANQRLQAGGVFAMPLLVGPFRAAQNPGIAKG